MKDVIQGKYKMDGSVVYRFDDVEIEIAGETASIFSIDSLFGRMAEVINIVFDDGNSVQYVDIDNGVMVEITTTAEEITLDDGDGGLVIKSFATLINNDDMLVFG